MKMKVAGLALAFAACLSVTALAGSVGNPLPKADLQDMTQTKARSLSDLSGRVILIEYFAYW